MSELQRVALARRNRLARSVEIKQVRRGRKFSASFCDGAVRTRSDSGSDARFCVVTSSRVGNAVVRNRVRRRVAEACRALVGNGLTGVDVLIRVRAGTEVPKQEILVREIGRVAR